MKKATITLSLIFVMLLTVLCGCGNSEDKPMKKYAGNWISDTKDEGYHYAFNIMESGELAMQYFESTDVVQWDYIGTVSIEEIDGKKLMCFSLRLENRTYAGYYEFSGNKNKLNLTYYDGEHVFNTSEIFNDGKVTVVKSKD